MTGEQRSPADALPPGATTGAAPRGPADGGRAQAGQATVELVLALPVVVLCLLLVLQVALVARAQVLVVHAAREGARAAAVDGTAAAARRAVGRVLAPGRSQVVAEIGRAPGGLATVTVRYRCPTDVALIGPLLGDPMLEAQVVMRLEDPTAAPDLPGPLPPPSDTPSGSDAGPGP